MTLSCDAVFGCVYTFRSSRYSKGLDPDARKIIFRNITKCCFNFFSFFTFSNTFFQGTRPDFKTVANSIYLEVKSFHLISGKHGNIGEML